MLFLGIDAQGLKFVRGHIDLSAEMTGRRAARIAGRRLPKTPRAIENKSASATSCGVMRNLNTTSLKLLKLMVPVAIPFIGQARRHPKTPPRNASNAPSIRKL